MAECEVCGNREAKFIVLIQGAKLNACPSCARSGKIVEEIRSPAPLNQPVRRQETELDLVVDYDQRIKSAREKRGWRTEELAKQLNEKESFLKRIEEGRARPNELLARSLEKTLGIELLEETDISSAPASPSSKKETTLGDIVIVKKKK